MQTIASLDKHVQFRLTSISLDFERPVSRLRKVVLPLPEGPMIAIIRPQSFLKCIVMFCSNGLFSVSSNNNSTADIFQFQIVFFTQSREREREIGRERDWERERERERERVEER